MLNPFQEEPPPSIEKISETGKKVREKPRSSFMRHSSLEAENDEKLLSRYFKGNCKIFMVDFTKDPAYSRCVLVSFFVPKGY